VNDKDGNTLSGKGLRYEERYEYNGHNRMVYSEVTSHVEKSHTVNSYAYDALGRRTLTYDVMGNAMRTVYDGRSFDVIREDETFRNGALVTQFATGATVNPGTVQPPVTRYRHIGSDNRGVQTDEDGYILQSTRSGGRSVTLYGNGEAVAVSYASRTSSRSVYLGKDILGSVRTTTTDGGHVEDRYEYDVFGKPYTGDLDGLMNLGYMSKPYNTATGMYNYGYRDYRPVAARFTTVDPIRDGSNWFVYVNNDPVNYIDMWGLSSALAGAAGILILNPEPITTVIGIVIVVVVVIVADHYINESRPVRDNEGNPIPIDQQ
jgi:RHS repeat-associated protein